MPVEGHVPEVARRLAWFTTGVAVLLLIAFAYLYAGGPPFIPAEGDDELGRVAVLLMVLVAGGIGGCFYNLRGITKHVRHQDFFGHFELTYLLRPVSGAICGVFVFTLAHGGVMTLTLGQASTVLNERSVVLYAGLALLAGYGSHEFLRKVKDLNRTLFALSEDERRHDVPDDGGRL